VLEAARARVPSLDPHGQLTVSATSASLERLFRSVWLVKSDLRSNLLVRTLVDVMWVEQAP
jgi:hypothetical protein